MLRRDRGGEPEEEDPQGDRFHEPTRHDGADRRSRRDAFALVEADPELALELEDSGYAGILPPELIGDEKAPAHARPAIDDPFGGPGPAGADPFADPLA